MMKEKRAASSAAENVLSFGTSCVACSRKLTAPRKFLCCMRTYPIPASAPGLLGSFARIAVNPFSASSMRFAFSAWYAAISAALAGDAAVPGAGVRGEGWPAAAAFGRAWADCSLATRAMLGSFGLIRRSRSRYVCASAALPSSVAARASPPRASVLFGSASRTWCQVCTARSLRPCASSALALSSSGRVTDWEA